MAAVLPESKIEALEDDDQALLGGEPKVEQGEELVDLNRPDEAPAAPAPAAPAAPAPAAEDDIPAEYKGKSLPEVIKMHREAQQVLGRQGTELGEFRRKADLLIQASLENLRNARQAPAAPPAAPAAPAVPDETEFFRDPKAAVEKLIAQHPTIQEIRKTLGDSAANVQAERATRATERFNQAHPDAPQIMQDPEFRQWVGASRVRTALLRQAHERFDFDAGDEVFSTWKALHKPAAAPAAPAAPDEAAVRAAAQTLSARKRAVADASVPTSGNAAPGQGGSKKIYRRADVLKLMETDRDRYEALAPEIELAYAEGRVR